MLDNVASRIKPDYWQCSMQCQHMYIGHFADILYCGLSMLSHNFQHVHILQQLDAF